MAQWDDPETDMPFTRRRRSTGSWYLLGGALPLGILLIPMAAQVTAQFPTPPSQGLAPGSSAPAQPDNARAARASYVGDEVCRSCHAEKVEAFHHTAHSLTSRLPDQDSILGKFTPGANVLKTSNPDLLFRMEEKGETFFQTAVEGVSPYTEERTERFGLVIGSGGKGQTYLFWKGDRLFQLPVSYWNQLGWVNSPGYRDGVANFERPINPRCLECHATYFEPLEPPRNRYLKSGFVVGITCEKCHGAGREHTDREGSKVARTFDPAILNPGRFPRDRQIDLCAWCHAGHGVPLVATFSYLAGEPLEKYIELPQPDPNAPIDVHGDQVGLLRKSRCFQSSAMTCLTCHDVHTDQHDSQAFSQRCLSCHKPQTSMFPKRGHQVASDCIGCHMPTQQTNLIVFNWQGNVAKPQVRSHWIKAYPEMAPAK